MEPLCVADLVRSPALQLRVLAGHGGLHREVSWAHVSELADPTPWLLGAELLMTTGMAVPRAAPEQRRYLELLDDAGVSALAVSAQLHAPALHRELFAAADERGMPLLEVPLSVPFVAIAQEVATKQDTEGHRLGAQLQVFGALRWLTEERLSAAEIFGRLERLSGYTLYLCTPQGRPLIPGVPAAPPTEAGALLPPSPEKQAPPTVPGGFVLPVPAPGGTAGYLIARARDGARPAGLAVVQHIATVASLQLTMLRHQRETLRREGAETLAELLADVLDPGTARRRLRRAGFPRSQRLVLAIVVGQGVTPDESALVREIELSDLPHLLLRQQSELFVLLPAGDATLTLLDGLTAAENAAEITAGSSSPFEAGEPLEIARREARWSLSRAADTGRTHVNYQASDPSGRWLPRDVSGLRALTDRVLGPATRYDAEHRTELVRTVRTWLERDRRGEDAARELHIHPNTLSYRLRRFTEVTGFRLESTGDLAEVWLALSAARHLGDH
ncbi:purine catabolism regulator [Pseudonocardia eucalypti]|uniref:PucR family transcriptional regulator ligand-binding domain-containing protein n=1 Tax=Pseudonocardia eucalypti TaxID=648755 RepID=UPI001853CDF1|nr:purine catabolism regulator [Pseudonocardia eucalypti]